MPRSRSAPMPNQPAGLSSPDTLRTPVISYLPPKNAPRWFPSQSVSASRSSRQRRRIFLSRSRRQLREILPGGKVSRQRLHLEIFLPGFLRLSFHLLSFHLLFFHLPIRVLSLPRHAIPR